MERKRSKIIERLLEGVQPGWPDQCLVKYVGESVSLLGQDELHFRYAESEMTRGQ